MGTNDILQQLVQLDDAWHLASDNLDDLERQVKEKEEVLNGLRDRMRPLAKQLYEAVGERWLMWRGDLYTVGSDGYFKKHPVVKVEG